MADLNAYLKKRGVSEGHMETARRHTCGALHMGGVHGCVQ